MFPDDHGRVRPSIPVTILIFPLFIYPGFVEFEVIKMVNTIEIVISWVSKTLFFFKVRERLVLYDWIFTLY